ncbi:MAG: hypothetical protein FalmKO_34190 [Falsiruegeria mediterranea]
MYFPSGADHEGQATDGLVGKDRGRNVAYRFHELLDAKFADGVSLIDWSRGKVGIGL